MRSGASDGGGWGKVPCMGLDMKNIFQDLFVKIVSKKSK
jgi:hypothetical protein